MQYSFAGKKLSSSQNANNDGQKKWKDKNPPPPLDRASFALFTESWTDKRNKFTPH